MRNFTVAVVLAVATGSFFTSCFLNGKVAIEWVELPEVRIPGTMTRILAFGDSGTGDDGQKAVASGMARRQLAAPFDFALLLGDNFYPNGVLSSHSTKFRTRFRHMYPASVFNFPFYVILGNHDYIGDESAQYDYTDPDKRWTAPGVAYLLPLRLTDGYTVDIYCLDWELLQDAATGDSREEDGALIYSWFLKSLRARTTDLVVLAIHSPFFSSGSHGNNPALAEYFREALEGGYLDVVVSAHEHDLELQARDVDADGEKELFVISGSAAKTRPVGSSGATLYSRAALGFAGLEISATGTSVSFYNASGDLLYHY